MGIGSCPYFEGGRRCDEVHFFVVCVDDVVGRGKDYFVGIFRSGLYFEVQRSEARIRFEQSGENHQQTLSGYGRDSVKGAADTYVHRLVVGIESQHIKSVGCYVVGGRTECDQPENGECYLKEMRSRNGECDTCQSGAYQHLHSDYPPSFGFQQIDERTPKRFDYPRQIKPTGI